MCLAVNMFNVKHQSDVNHWIDIDAVERLRFVEFVQLAQI